MFYCFNLSAYIRVFIKDLMETNVNISNEHSFSDVYRSVNCTETPAKFTFTLQVTKSSLHFDKSQKN